MTIEEDLDEFCHLAIKLGAKDAKVIRAEDIVVSEWVRLKCQYGCGNYGQSLTCPPHTPDPEEFRKVLKGYEWAVLIKFEDVRQGGSWESLHDVVAKLEREIFLSGYHSAFGLASGPCPYCTECNLEECVHSEIARPSMEGCGIDVYSTVRKAGFKLEVVKNREDRPVYFGLVLVK